MNTSLVIINGIVGDNMHQQQQEQQWSTLHCSKDALTDFYGWMLQGLLAGLAFTCLIAKRFCEPVYVRRSWETWWYDTSKQGIGALVIHMTNVYLAPLFQGDPCTWYIINFLLDSTIGLFIIYVGIRVCHYLAVRKKWEAINFGEYNAPKSWICQTWIYIGLMVIVKLTTTILLQWDIWDNVKNFVLSPFSDPKIELAVIMLIIPFFVNMFIFWVTDNFLMRHNRKTPKKPNLLQRVKVRYRAIRKRKDNESESEALISGDDEMLGTSSPIIISSTSSSSSVTSKVLTSPSILSSTSSSIMIDETKKLHRSSVSS